MSNFKNKECVIDFYGGTHGNFLEYIINRYIFLIDCCKDFSPFNSLGTAHAKNDNEQYLEDRKILAGHFSSHGIEVPASMPIIKIKVSKDNQQVVTYNAILRAGDQFFDIDALEKDTLSKLPRKHSSLKKDILNQLGNFTNYSRKDIRNFFFSKFNEGEYGIDMMNYDANPTHTSFEVDIGTLFDFQKFIMMLGDIANFLNRRFIYDETLCPIWLEFMSKNHGYNSFLKTRKIIDNILQCQDYDFIADLIEEAYINFFISKAFGVYENVSCFGDNFPTNTKHILDEIMVEKERLRWT